jgi:iron complex transport system permease protein
LNKQWIHTGMFLIAIALLVWAELYLRPSGVDLMLFRFPRLLTTVFVGISLSISGLIIQTVFRNPLAGPYITGVIPGAYFAVAVFLLLVPFLGSHAVLTAIGLKAFAMVGGLSIMLLQLVLLRKYKSVTIMLLFGVVLGYFLSGGSQVLVSVSSAKNIQSFVQWGFGSFDKVFGSELWILGGITAFTIMGYIRLIGPLQVYIVGDDLAANTGVNLRSLRFWSVALAGATAGLITAYCGPISFVGMVAPQFIRLISPSQALNTLSLNTMLAGIVFCLMADVASHYLIENMQLSVNAMAAILGAPIVAISLFANRKLF